MRLRKSIKFGNYKLSARFILKEGLKRKDGGLPLYCRLTYKRRYTEFPVVGELRFENENHIPTQVTEDAFELIKSTFGECCDPTREGSYSIVAFLEKYRVKREGKYSMPDLLVSLIVNHLHRCFEKNLITERQLNLCKEEILKRAQIIQS